MNPKPSETADREIRISRVFNAPRELVFETWTDPAHVTHWWGPEGFSTTTRDHRLEVGGEWNFVMHGPDGTDYKNRIVFTEVDRPAKLAYRHSGVDEHDYVHFTNTVSFEELPNGKTRVTMHSIFPTAAERDRVERDHGAIEGGMQTLDRFGRQVASRTSVPSRTPALACGNDLEFRLTRSFRAPRSLVFEAFTKAEHLRNWLACHPVTACEVDARPGGKLRLDMRMADGTECTLRGEYREVSPPDRLVYTHVYALPGVGERTAVVTAAFVERDGTTTVTQTYRHDSREIRDEHLALGVEAGATHTFDQLDELLGTLA